MEKLDMVIFHRDLKQKSFICINSMSTVAVGRIYYQCICLPWQISSNGYNIVMHNDN